MTTHRNHFVYCFEKHIANRSVTTVNSNELISNQFVYEINCNIEMIVYIYYFKSNNIKVHNNSGEE